MPKKKVTRGRPRIFSDGAKRVAVQLEPKTLASLKKYAASHCWSLNQAVRLILEEKLNKKRIPK